MTITKADLRNAALRYLSVLPEGQAATPHQVTTVESVIDRAQAFLESEGLAYWETTAIPDDVANAYRRFIAAEVAPELMEPDRAGPYVAMRGDALTEIRRMVSLPNRNVRAEYF